MIDVYQTITDRIIAQLEQGTAPWVKPWSCADRFSVPYNAITGRPYRGINTMILFAPAAGNGWMTYKQAQNAGAQVRKGEKGQQIVFFKPWEDKNDTSEDSVTRRVMVLKAYTVFHTSQIDGLDAKYLPSPVAPKTELEICADAERMLSHAVVNLGNERAFYSPDRDQIFLPGMAQFRSVPDYYATALHELTHWTGHKARLARDFSGRFGSQAYAREELVAEMGAAFLCAHAGIDGQLQHASYIESWLQVLKSDKRAVVMAAAMAQRAADLVLGVRFEEPAQECAA